MYATNIAAQPLGRELYVDMRSGTAQIADKFSNLPSGSLNPIALSFILQSGFVPYPFTVTNGVFSIGVGDSLQDYDFGEASKGWLRRKSGGDFPYLSTLSSQEEHPSPRRLLQKLASATERAIAGTSHAILMLSSGKDSSALALAIAEIGAASRVTAITYEDGESGEGASASKIAKAVGIKHEVVRLPSDISLIARHVSDFWARTSVPCGDPATLAYVIALKEAGVHGSPILDGMGNDIYFGYVPRIRDDHKCAMSLHVPVTFLPERSVARIPLMSRAEKMFLSAHWMGPRRCARHLGVEHNVNRYWHEYERELGNISLLDLRATVRGKHFDFNSAILKAKVAAESCSSQAVFPWNDIEVADYCFNLPQACRFDLRTRTNKILLRQLLEERIEFSRLSPVKRGFEFSMHQVLSALSPGLNEHIFQSDVFLDKQSLIEWKDAALARGVKDHRHLAPVNALLLAAGWMSAAPGRGVRC